MCQTWKHRQSTPFGPESRMPRHQIFAFCLRSKNCNKYALDQLRNMLPLATSLIASPGDTFQASAADACHLRRRRIQLLLRADFKAEFSIAAPLRHPIRSPRCHLPNTASISAYHSPRPHSSTSIDPFTRPSIASSCSLGYYLTIYQEDYLISSTSRNPFRRRVDPFIR